MQNLYYTSESRTLLVDDGTNQQYQLTNITALIPCGSLQQLVAFSGSTQVSSFSINDTNIFYTASIFASETTSSTYSANLAVVYQPNNIDKEATEYTAYYITSSNLSISGSSTAESYVYTIPSNEVYTFSITSSNTYTTQLTVIDKTLPAYYPLLPGAVIVDISGSDQGISASVYLSASHDYIAYLSIIGTIAP